LDLIDLIDVGGGVSEALSHFAIVGEKEEASGVLVEPSDGIDAFFAATLDEEHDGVAFLWVVEGGDIAFRFVEEKIAFGFAAQHFAAIGDDIALVDFETEGGDDLSVDGDSAGLDQLVGFAARAYAGVGDVFVETCGAVVFGFGRGLTIFAAAYFVGDDILRAFEAVRLGCLAGLFRKAMFAILVGETMLAVVWVRIFVIVRMNAISFFGLVGMAIDFADSRAARASSVVLFVCFFFHIH
jgi:hypothetical protein